jgi:cobalt/nickel transport system ATP-binding protein
VLELCPRTVLMDRGRIVADGTTLSLLSDARLLAAHRLELPYGLQLPGRP